MEDNIYNQYEEYLICLSYVLLQVESIAQTEEVILSGSYLSSVQTAQNSSSGLGDALSTAGSTGVPPNQEQVVLVHIKLLPVRRAGKSQCDVTIRSGDPDTCTAVLDALTDLLGSHST